ncbi:NAD dependent epimerase/dehydratase [Paragonimus heterotremus]|uniref:NAD dependent epimerase/dehydratase n=1 Tax=Paragonimus heterotremus TaxID=100268 RepID=A0A8J4TA04_9TREM|nr:NAD dependent epimerase/dehydratase [Paragonimus heterotremus]
MIKYETAEKRDPLLVIGAGVCRTGTKSLAVALEILYGQPCYHLDDAMHSHPDHIKQWLKLCNQWTSTSDDRINASVVQSILQGHIAVAGPPAYLLYQQLMELYPEAKVILTVRHPASWLHSMQETTFRLQTLFGPGIFNRFLEHIYVGPKFGALLGRTIQLTYGEEVNTEMALMAAYESWIEQVTRSVPPERLLTFQVIDGWLPLCQFLDQPIPNTPFPHVNEREETQQLVDKFVTTKTYIQIFGILFILVIVLVILFLILYFSLSRK